MPQEQTGISTCSVIKAEYRDMPYLNLTKSQMQRSWGLAFVCDAVVEDSSLHAFCGQW